MITYYVILTKSRGKTTLKITNTYFLCAVFFIMHQFYLHLFLESTLPTPTEPMQKGKGQPPLEWRTLYVTMLKSSDDFINLEEI